MKRRPGLFVLMLATTLVLGASTLASAEGTGTVTQIGLDNYAYMYQEATSEAIIMQLGNTNSASVEQEGPGHLGGVGQVGDENECILLQLGQKDLAFSIQSGNENYASITQMHSIAGSSSYRNISDNDAFSYQSGLNNRLELLQTGDDNTASVSQMNNNNEALVVQSQHTSGTGAQATFIVQSGIGNWVVSQQDGTHHVSRCRQFGDTNSALVNQDGLDNTASVVQTGNSNAVTINQG